MRPNLPQTRGPLTAALIDHWTRATPLPTPSDATDLEAVDPLIDDDLQLALWCCFNLHYRGFDGVDEALEWEPATLAFRRSLEDRFELALRAEHDAVALAEDPIEALQAIVDWPGPPLSRVIEQSGGHRELCEFAIHRSAYQLKEADPHTFAIPRLAGPGRAAMIEIQADEYGAGVPGAAHSELFAAAMGDLGLCPSFGHYLDLLPGTTLATDNLASLFGLQRRLRGALVGHLAVFERCSVVPMSRYLAAARRVGELPNLERFYAVHVEADVHHAELARHGMVQGTIGTEPELGPDIVFGAAALSRVEARFAAAVLDAWRDGLSSLRPGPSGRRGAGRPEASALAGMSMPSVAGSR